MDVDMDIDMDIDIQLDGDDFMDPEQPAAQHQEVQPIAPVQHISLPADTITIGADDTLPILDKIHIRGVDHLSSADLKQFAGEHYPLDQFERIEWIDDTSANFIYSTANAASEALIALTSADIPADNVQLSSPLQLRPTKPISSHPETQLYVRQATSTDVKQKGAHESSRYYLLNPDQDPRERRKQQDGRRMRGGRRPNGNGEYTRIRFDDNEHNKRRRDDANNGFNADMYDDDAGDESDRRSTDYERRKRLRTRRSRDELFPSKVGRSDGGRLRGRSASPLGDGDGRLGFGDDLIGSRARQDRRRSRSPLRDPQRPPKDLFPSMVSNSKRTSAQQKELFPNTVSASSGGMRSVELTPPNTATESRLNRNSLELFPNKRGSFSHHRRSAAVDSTPGRERSLAERITPRPSTAPLVDEDGFRVRGAANTAVIQNGISIRGMATQQTPTVRELFPLKAGSNAGKELFGEKIKGRGGPRRKAEDMFS